MELPELGYLRLVVERYAKVVDALKLSSSEQPLVLPTSSWFPDRFTGDRDSFERLLARMQGYAGLEDVEIDAQLVGEVEGESCGTGGCGSGGGCSTAGSSTAAGTGGGGGSGCGTGGGGCGSAKPAVEGPRLLRSDDGYAIEMPAKALSHSIAFTASIARMLGQVRLLEAGQKQVDGATGELGATALGFGVLLLEASYIYSKGCGGPSVGKATVLSLGELVLPFALFVAAEGHKVRAAEAELSVTQRALLEEAWALSSSNRALVDKLKRAPDQVAAGKFELGEARSWLARVFGSKKRKTNPELEALAALERGDSLDDVAALLGSEPRTQNSGKPVRNDEDLRALVDEALAEMRQEQDEEDRRAAE